MLPSHFIAMNMALVADMALNLQHSLTPSHVLADATRQLNCSHLFSSRLAGETLSKVVGQMAETCLHLSRDLLMLLTLIVSVGEQVSSSDVYGYLLCFEPGNIILNLLNLIRSRSL